MTTYNYRSNTTSYGQATSWANPLNWTGGSGAPNDPSADVVIATGEGDNIALTGDVSINSLTLDNSAIGADQLSIAADAVLTVAGAVDISGYNTLLVGGTLNAGSIDIASDPVGANGDGGSGGGVGGYGVINCTGSFLNTGTLGAATVTAASFDNQGALDSNLTLTVAAGGFANLSGSTLTGGSYVLDGEIKLNIGTVITALAANVVLKGGDLQSWDSASSTWQSIEQTVQTIATGGKLTLDAQALPTWGSLAVDGEILLQGGALTTPQLTVDADGSVMGVGAVSGPVVDNGLVMAGLLPADYTSPLDGGSTRTAASANGYLLEITGAVTGTGTLEIGPTPSYTYQLDNGPGQQTGSETAYYPWTLELGSSASANVVFADAHGVLQLDDPSGFTGSIALAGPTDVIELADIALSSVTGYSYAGDAQGGTLAIDLSGGSEIDLKFVGDFDTASFTLSAGINPGADPGLAISTAAVVTSTGASTAAAVDLVRDDFTQGDISGVLIENASGVVETGQVSSGELGFTRQISLGPEWKIVGTGAFSSENGYSGGNQPGPESFILENTAGQVYFATVNDYAGPDLTHVTNLGSEWSFEATGEFEGGGNDQFLIENTSGVLELGDWYGSGTSLVKIGAIGSEWKIVGAGSFLGDGRAEFLMENTSGLVEIGQLSATDQAQYVKVASFGPEWSFEATGDFLGDGRTQFLIENTNGVLELGEAGTNNQAQYTKLTALGPEWKVVGAGHYTAGVLHDQVLLENTNGGVWIGDWSGGQMRFTQVGALGSEWSFHN